MTDYEKILFECGYYAGYMVHKAEKKQPPEVHGRWLTNPDTNTPQCSKCGCTLDNRTPYCPICGARMDEVATTKLSDQSKCRFE